MFPAAIQPKLSCPFTIQPTPPSLVSLKTPVLRIRKPRQLGSTKTFCITAASGVAQDTLNPDSASPNPPRKKKLGVVLKPMEKPRLVLKFIWMQKNIGISIDQVIPGYGTIPLSPYYFWPRKDAWEELKTLLEGKPWISQKQIVILLNQATDIINLWQESGGDLA
ncbi:OLC1v1010759C1 [Oldenlandia corymbosa var. corymbosa]|uniref:OLC1v1010759C1 n=1 Tax=Oldenlandia corymbosa var. corymbosa TaxID=529605 RepID=A0AAV1DS43_OLDCO|nr:OLC1v1010759C1 [Oldenlandia corymbosa var. corymbosa]